MPGMYNHPAHVERLNMSSSNLPVVLDLCPDGVPNQLGYTVGSKGDEDMLGVAIRVALDPDPKKHIKVSWIGFIYSCVEVSIYY